MSDRGRDDCIKSTPPSEPDRRFSRIRLSRRLVSDGEAEGLEYVIDCGAMGLERELRLS